MARAIVSKHWTCSSLDVLRPDREVMRHFTGVTRAQRSVVKYESLHLKRSPSSACLRILLLSLDSIPIRLVIIFMRYGR